VTSNGSRKYAGGQAEYVRVPFADVDAPMAYETFKQKQDDCVKVVLHAG